MAQLTEVLGSVLQPLAVSVATVAVLALGRLILPANRWNRRLRHDGAVLASLPEGNEKRRWEESVTAQAERLRIYYEDRRPLDQVVAWYAFVCVASVPVLLTSELLNGGQGFAAAVAEGPIMIPLTLLALMSLSLAAVISVRLVMGKSTSFSAGSGGRYPKYARLQRLARRRSKARSDVERRLTALRGRADLQRAETKREQARAIKESGRQASRETRPTGQSKT